MGSEEPDVWPRTVEISFGKNEVSRHDFYEWFEPQGVEVSAFDAVVRLTGSTIFIFRVGFKTDEGHRTFLANYMVKESVTINGKEIPIPNLLGYLKFPLTEKKGSTEVVQVVKTIELKTEAERSPPALVESFLDSEMEPEGAANNETAVVNKKRKKHSLISKELRDQEKQEKRVERKGSQDPPPEKSTARQPQELSTPILNLEGERSAVAGLIVPPFCTERPVVA